MKNSYILLLPAAAALCLSCVKEPGQAPGSKPGGQVTIKVSTSDAKDESKVSLTEAVDKSAMNLAWETGDQISINGEPFTISNIISNHEAEFTGDAPSGDSYTIIYPGDKYADAAAFAARSYAGQTQDGNSSTAHLEYNAMLAGVDAYTEPKFDPDWATLHSGTLSQNGVIQLRLQLPAGVTAVNSITLSASAAVFPTTNAGGEKVKEQTLALNSCAPNEKRIVEAYMMFSAAGVTFTAGDKLTVAVETPAAVYVRTLPDMTAQTWNGGGQYTIQCKVQDENVFEIEDAADLEEFRDGVNSGSILWQLCHVTLKNDIDCSGISSWTPIGNGTFEPVESGTVSATWTEPAFKGVFDGQNHAIKNLNMTGSPATYAPYGLFGILYKATVKDLTLGAASGDTGKLEATPVGRMDAGAVAGVSYGATVQNVTNYFPMTIPSNSSENRVAMGMVGYVYGDSESGLSVLSGLNNYGAVNATQSASNTGNGAISVQVAGIAGFSNSGGASTINEISTCTNYADVVTSTGRSAGVLATANTRTAVNGCHNRGDIDNTFTNARVGGITVIIAANCSITDCINFGKVQATGSGSNLGGIVCLVNHASAEVSGSRNEGVVVGTNYVGGIASRIYAGTITTCVNTGNVTGAAEVGGIVGGLGNNNGWPHIEKCRSNATVTGTGICVGGIAGQILGGVLNTCSAKGSVTSASYDVGGIVGQMYCNQAAGGTYGRQYVFDCLAAADVATSRTSDGAANLGGVVGRIIRKNDANNNAQFMAVDNCIGLNQTLSAGSNLTYVGAFAGLVTASVATNYKYVRVRNNISLVENANLVCTATSNKGGFVGSMPFGYMEENYYLVDDNSQTFGGSGKTTTSNVTQSDLATLTGSTFCAEHSSRATGYNLTVNGVQYKSSGWEIPAGVSYPVPSSLAALGEDYYK